MLLLLPSTLAALCPIPVTRFLLPTCSIYKVLSPPLTSRLMLLPVPRVLFCHVSTRVCCSVSKPAELLPPLVIISCPVPLVIVIVPPSTVGPNATVVPLMLTTLEFEYTVPVVSTVFVSVIHPVLNAELGTLIIPAP